MQGLRPRNRRRLRSLAGGNGDQVLTGVAPADSIWQCAVSVAIPAVLPSRLSPCRHHKPAQIGNRCRTADVVHCHPVRQIRLGVLRLNIVNDPCMEY